MNLDDTSMRLYCRIACLCLLMLVARVGSAADTNQFIRQITNKLGVPFPAGFKVENVETNVGREPFGYRTNLTHEWFAVVTMSPTNAVTFKRDILAKKRDPNLQWLGWEDKESIARIGVLPGPETIPKHVKEWWGKPKSDTLINLEEFRVVGTNSRSHRGGVVVFLSQESGKLWIWAYEIQKKDP